MTENGFSILGSKHPTVLFTDLEPIILLSTQNSNPNLRVYRFQLTLKTIFKPTYSLDTLPDTFTQNTQPEEFT